MTGLLAVSGRSPEGRRPVEVTIVAQHRVKPWRYPPSFDFQYGEWLRAEFEGGATEPWPTTTNPDLALLLTMVLQANRALFGPSAEELLEPVPAVDLTRALVESVDGLIADLEWDTRNVALTLARIWFTVDTGEIASKDAAASWALERLPPRHRDVLARARAIYLGEEQERWDDLRPRVRPYADHVAGEIRRLHVARGAS